MKLNNTFAAALIAGLCLTATADIADAASITVENKSVVTGAVDNPLATAMTGTVNQNVTGSITNQRLDPFAGTALAGSAYTSVQRNSSATYDFGGIQNAMSLLWGSPDEDVEGRNKIEFYLGGALVDTVTAKLIEDTITNPAEFNTSFVTVFHLKFDTAVFSNNSANAFEYGNLSVEPIPLPAAGWMLLAGVGGMAAMRRRKKA
jgi:hypothetical protein